MRTSLKAVLAIIFLLSAQNLQAAVTLQIDASGQLTGALGVSANGGTYDVSFVYDSPRRVFDNDTANLDATVFSEAEQFSQALLDQVFIGVYDTNPSLIAGNSGLSCLVWTPYDIDYSVTNSQHIYRYAIAWNYSLETADKITGGIGTEFPLTLIADWEVVSVPAPASLALLTTGLASIGLTRKRKAC